MNSPATSSVITTRYKKDGKLHKVESEERMENYTKSSQKKGWKTTQSRVRRKDGKLHKVESEERMKNILEAARHNIDHEIEF
jgi:DUF4097 and DUF4098 domain-containing protein YvlB